MSLRCGCVAEGDETVFGPVHECSKDPAMKPGSQARTVRDPGVYRLSHLNFTPEPRPYEVVLSPDELED